MILSIQPAAGTVVLCGGQRGNKKPLNREMIASQELVAGSGDSRIPGIVSVLRNIRGVSVKVESSQLRGLPRSKFKSNSDNNGRPSCHKSGSGIEFSENRRVELLIHVAFIAAAIYRKPKEEDEDETTRRKP